MTGHFLLDWAVMAVSFFNTILLLWLSLTVLLNAERHRSWGVWLSSGGLFVGGLFFFCHSIVLGDGLHNLLPASLLWWYLDFSWIPVTALPFTWYVVMLWYAGFWDEGGMPRQRWHWMGMLLALTLAMLGVVLLIATNPSLSFARLTRLNLAAGPAIAGLPLLALVFPVYLIACIGLSVDALRHPAPSQRVMGDLARQRARPWLVATAVALLLVSLLVARGVLWVARNTHAKTLYDVLVEMQLTVARYDLVVAGLIGLSILTLGQAIVAYEVFTGNTLPRRGLRRYWRNAVLLAIGYGIAVALSQLLATLLMTLFYALLSWRAFAERERYIAQLRPFVTSQRLYEHLVKPANHAPSSGTEPAVQRGAGGIEQADGTLPFYALCSDLLGTRVAYLLPLGPLAPLAGAPLVFPRGLSLALPPLSGLVSQFHSPQTMCVPLEPARYSGLAWAVPLWSERGLIGALLLGEKWDGALYTQEEIEIARASGERLIDTQASATLARRLMALQRQRLAESQVLDRRARRTLHDEVLPRLHTAMLTLKHDREGALEILAGLHRQISDLLREMPTATTREVGRVGLVGALRKVMEDELDGAFDQVAWRVEPQAEREAGRVPALTAEVLFYAAREAIRNAARHGRDAGRPLHLELLLAWRDGLEMCIQDDGVGFPAPDHTGVGPTPGGGQGLSLHSTMMAVVGGALAVEGEPGRYTRVTLTLPAVILQPPAVAGEDGQHEGAVAEHAVVSETRAPVN